jgi:hypothetical protein
MAARPLKPLPRGKRESRVFSLLDNPPFSPHWSLDQGVFFKREKCIDRLNVTQTSSHSGALELATPEYTDENEMIRGFIKIIKPSRSRSAGLGKCP